MLKYNRKNILIGCTILLALAGYVILLQNYMPGNISTVANTFFAVKLIYFIEIGLLIFRIQIGKSWKQIHGKIANIVIFLTAGGAITFIEEYMWNPYWISIRKRCLVIDYMFVLALMMTLLLIIKKTWIAYWLTLLLSFIYGLINFFVLKFKGCPPSINDLMAARTAFTVMGNYEYSIDDNIVVGLILFLAVTLLLLYITPTDRERISVIKRTKVGIIICNATIVVGIWALIMNFDLTSIGITISGWNVVDNFYSNGALSSMLVSIQNIKPKKPQNYNKKSIEEKLEIYEKEIVEENDKTPSIIVIMNESFSDLHVIGDFKSDDYMPYLDSMKDYVMKGNVYASVNGGGTCNSEFEFLTGSSMASYDSNIFPYQSFDLSKSYSIPEVFSNLGYETVAFHPYEASNWNRKNVYKELKFASYLSINDMEKVVNASRFYASDRSDYEKIEEIYENRKNPLFLFNVTIQNHGGYFTELNPEIENVEIEEQYSSYEDVITYLSLIKESDKAFHELIEYFSKQTDPVIVCMFGDHQPALNSEFMTSIEENSNCDEMEKMENRLVTPYVIWSNYDTGFEQTDMDLSLNYLGANILKIVGKQTAYSKYLLDLEEQLPVINTVGYQDNQGVWHLHSETNELIEEYEAVQYYELFRR